MGVRYRQMPWMDAIRRQLHSLAPASLAMGRI